MKEFIKKNFAILLAFALPIALIAIVAFSIYLPSAFLSTDYNFIYSSCSSGINRYPYSCNTYLQERYSIVDDKLAVKVVSSTDIDKNYTARVFLHNTKNNESREITLEEARAFTLNSLLTSPDGVTVSGHYDRGAGFPFIFDSGSSYGYYLTKGKSKSKLNLINSNDRYYYRDNFQFIGWVLPGRNE